ncbi:CapA family protein [Streptomyces sp. S4.7]|uniref:CapA family protein n=1 Tax=Streptomyces sp. S4.7 TaxID=2705439 RepID=UPI001EF25C2F|nr:CapA family protein [Streptomyces sp. S4.7]
MRPHRHTSDRGLRLPGSSAALVLALLATTAAGCSVVGGGSDDTAPKGDPAFTVAAAGDILIHPQLTEQAYRDAGVTQVPEAVGRKVGAGVPDPDFGKIMAGVKPVISKADLAICHFEPVVAGPKGPFRSFPDFLVPPQITTAIKKTGYDTCSTASNHTLDDGPQGVTRTLDALDAAGLKHTGSARSAAEGAKPLIVDVKGVRVAQLSYAFGFNGREIPADKPWLANENSFDAIAAAEKAARGAGAEAVILSIHWGREHHPDPSASQLKLGRRIAKETGIDLVIGHHAHVVQPMEKVDGTWIAYGLGNQLARHDVPSGLTEEGAIGWFEFREKPGGGWDVEAWYAPTFVTIPPEEGEESEADGADGAGVEQSTDGGKGTKGAAKDHRLLDIAGALRADKDLSAEERAQYRLAFERTRGTMLNRGAAGDGLRPLSELPD